ncbi:hypothetical protein NECAME_07120, partial [Necator americanus]
LSNKYEAGAHSFAEHLKNVSERITHYQNYFKEFVKYTARANQSSKSMQKALELTLGIPQRVHDLVYTNNIQQYPGDTGKLGRLIRHDSFEVAEGDEPSKERYVFLFKNKLMITDKNDRSTPATYTHYATIRLDKYTVSAHKTNEDTIVLKPNELGLPEFSLKPKDSGTSEYVRKAWLKDIAEEQEAYVLIFVGPEEGGPPRKKVKSPPAISPTGSSTSIYSGGSSSIDWSEYKDDVQLHEDDRHTFYADDDGFFAMTIDPVQVINSVADTGRYTCMATNEYGQASTSAFFRVLKVEKEAAPPKFVNTLKDQECKEGEVISFECEVEGWPEPELVWLVDDQPLRPSHDFKIEYDGMNAKLEIRDAQPDDTGVYCVKLQNEFGTAESKAELVVIPDPDKNHVAPEFQGSNRLGTTSCDGRLKVRVPPAPPSFAKPLEDRVVQENSVVSFEVDVLGWPEPTVTFTLKGKEVEFPNILSLGNLRGGYVLQFQLKHGVDGVEIAGADGFYKVIISGCKMDQHDGEIVCRAVNEHGTAESRARLTVEPMEEESRSAPTFIKDIEDQTVKYGVHAVFETTVRGSPNPEVTWYINGVKMDKDTPGVKIEVVNHDHKLTIDSAHYAGTVLCRAENVVGRFETKARLTVIPQEKPKKAPRFSELLTDKTETEGNTVVFEARVEAEPKPDIKWYLKGVELTASEIEAAPSKSVVTEETVKEEFHQETTMARTPTIQVTTTEEVRDEMHATSVAGTDVQEPVGKVEEVAKEETAAEQKLETTTQVNELPKITKDLRDQKVVKGEQGKFDVVVENAKEAKWYHNGTELTTTTEGVKITEETKYEFKLSIDSTIFLTGTISVKITGLPEPTVKWSINDKLIEESNTVMISRVENEYTLKITETSTSHTGTVKVTAENAVGSDSKTAELKVEEGLTAPNFISQMSDTTVNVDEQLKMQVVLEKAHPLTSVKWYNNGREMQPGPGVEMTEPQPGTYNLVIEHVKEEMAGTITAKGSNPIGECGCVAKLTVAKASKKPQFTKTPQNHEAYLDDESVKFSAIVVGTPTPKVDRLFFLKSTTAPFQASNPGGMKKQNVTLNVKRVGEAPTFSKNLEDRLVTEGEVTIMEAKLNQVKPKPTITWLRDGKEFKSDDHFVLIEEEDGTLQMKIITTKMEDKCRITIKAENYFGVAECSASLGVIKPRPMAKPAFQSDIAPINLTEGDSLQTKLLITGDPPPFVKWYINNQLVCPTEDTEIINVDGVYSLTIHGVTADMTGKIKCVAYNKMGEVTTEGDLKVVAPIPVEFETSLCDATCREGDTLKLKAVLLGEPTPVVSWYVNGKKLEETQNIKIHAEKGTYTVTIKDITCDYSGKVVCEAVNEYGKASSEAMLLVLPRGEPPDFLEWLSNVRARQGSKVVHKVVFTGDPKPTLTWYINNKEVTNSKEISIVTDDKTSVLMINNFNPEVHVGEIICKAENDAGEVSCTANMATYTSEMFSESESEAQAEEVIGDDMTLTDDESLRDELIRTPTPVMAPKFITKIKDSRAKRGHEAIFECVVPDTKGVVCKWLKDGKEIELIARIRVQTRTIEGHTTQELIIEDVRPEDAGTYTVIVENTAGRDVCEATLTVVEQLDKIPDRAPEFIVQLQDKTTMTNEKVTFECKVVGEPQPNVVWYHDNVSANGFKIFDRIRICFTRTTRDLMKVGYKMLTWYPIFIPGQARRQVQLCCRKCSRLQQNRSDVKCPWYLVLHPSTNCIPAPLAPTFTKPLTDQSISIGDQLVLFCSIKGMPQPTVEFYHETVRIRSSERISIEHDASNTHWRILIKESVEEDLGKYRAVAKNTVGTAISEATVTRKSVPPMFEQGLKSTSVKESEEIRMEVKDTRASDVGTYTCQATNKAGKDVSVADIKIPKYGFEKIKAEQVEPLFIEPLQEAVAAEGKTVVLECRVNKESQPEIRWFKDDAPIELGQHMVMETLEDGKIKLTIHNTTKEDIGSYRCEAVNVAGKAKTEARLQYATSVQEIVADESEQLAEITPDTARPAEAVETKAGRGPPEFVELLRSCTVNEKQQAVLKCKVKGEPRPKIKWTKEGKEVEMLTRIRTEYKDDGTLTMTIDEVTQQDAGEYRCYAENELGSAWTEGPIIIAAFGAPPQEGEAPDFIMPVRPVVVGEGETAVLEGKISGKPKPTVKWYKNGELLKPSDKVVMESLDDGTQRLTVKDATMNDMDEYRCEASNEFGDVWSDVTLTVKAKPQEAPSFEKTLVEVAVVEGETATYECKVTGQPQPEIKWFKDKEEISSTDQHFVQTREADGTVRLVIRSAKLTIDKAKLADQGNYRVEATNAAGSMSSKAPLSVQAPETLKIKKPLSDVNTERGTKILLSVEVEGKPKTVKWYKGTEQVTTTSTTKIEQVSDVEYKLVVENCEMTDAGAYRVVLSTESESVESSCTVTISEKAVKVLYSAAHLHVYLSLSTVQGQTLVLEVEVEGQPKKVKWYKNGDELKDAKAEDLGNGKYRLTVPDFKDSDVGEYSVTAENDVGEVESKSKVTLQGPTDDGKGKPEIVSGLVPTTVKQGETAMFSVKVKGPVKTVKWYKNGKEVPDAKTKDNSDGSYELSVPNAQKEDMADYKVVISNDAGDAESSAALTVKLPGIEIVKGLADTTVPQKQTGTLEIETNKPPKEVKWYKNGKEITPSDKAQPKKVDNNKYQLVIPDAGKDDTADYKVVLTDDDGNNAESSCALTVKLPGIEIVKGLEDTSVPEGQKAVLSVETSQPPKQIKWLVIRSLIFCILYKNGKELSPSDKAKPEKVADNKYQLVIPDTGKDDTANYTVMLTDDDGNNAESSCALTVKLPGIEIVKGLEDTSVSKGQKAVLSVETNGPPKEIKWYKNGKELSPSDKAKPEKVADNKYQLLIPDTDKDDTADYKVSREMLRSSNFSSQQFQVVLIDDDGNSADSSCALTVKLPSPIEIVKGLEDTTVPKGQKAVLEVESSKPPKQVKWWDIYLDEVYQFRYKNGKELSPSDKSEHKQIGDNKHQLVIPDANDEDTADYKVILTDDDGNTADSFCSLTVRLPDKEPKIIKGLGDRTVPCGLPTIWEVETENEPRVVKWYKNGKELAGAAAAQVKISKIDDNHYTLEVDFVLVVPIPNSGDYKVEVSNDAGMANSSGKLTVEPQITFLTPLKDQEITEGENAEFQVETNAKPHIVKWYKNGQEITPDARFVISGGDTKYKLVIKNATREDAAEFKIVAKGASLVFEVKVEGEVEEVRWAKDTVPIIAGTNAIIEKVDDQTYRLTIPKADFDNAGHYTVEAINESGKAASDAKGEVDEKPEIVKGLNDIEVSEGDDEVFKVEVSTPVRTVKWYKNGQELKPSIHMEQKKIGPKKYELAINRAEMDDGATYRVVLSNAAGECDSSAQLTVTKPNILKMLEGLKDIDVDEGQPIELKVKVEGMPKTVKWYKNGAEITPSDHLQLKENPETGEYSLLIPQSEKSDGAAYRILLANDKGEIYSGSIAHVKTPKLKDIVKPANFLSPLEDTEVLEGETLTLKCVVAGDPFPELTWTKDGVELEKDERLVMRVALDGTATLRIRDAKKSDFGQYRITAKNEGGTETSACQVTVKEKGEEPSKPRFIIPLKSCEAEIGAKQMFEVKVRGFPKPTLEWLLNEQPLVLDDRVTVEDLGAGNYCLTIKDVSTVLYSSVRLFYGGARGGRETDDRYPPRFNVPLWDRRIPINDPLSIECHVDAKPTAEIEWFKDGKKLEASESVEIRNTPDGACRVRIARFGREEVGVYQCVATNPLGVAETRSTYTVEVTEEEEIVERKEYAPRFNPGLQDKAVNAGQSVRLSCAVDALPKAGVSDEGAYRCVASNEHGSTNTSCLVSVKVPKTEAKKEGEEPFFTKGLVDMWTDRGETFTMTCAVKGDPFPEIKWYRNGTLVRSTARTIIETTEEGICSLTVKECTMSDEGIYRCEAENKYGKAKTQATTHVQVSLGKGEAPMLEMGSPPKFVIPLEDQTVLLNGIIDLECKVTGQPMPQVKWSKDGGPIWEDSRYQWEIDEAKEDSFSNPQLYFCEFLPYFLFQGMYHLRITSATVNDEGTYRCVATNESGSATTKSFVRIDDGMLPAHVPATNVPPRFTIRLGDARAIEGQPLRLECKVEGSPLPNLTWHKDGAQIQPSDRIQITMDPDGTARLVIPQCCMDDEGIYRVIATNPSGSAHDKGNATVKRAPRDAERRDVGPDEFDANKVPRLVEPLENVKVPEKQPFRLRCKFSGEGKLAIKWFKDGERVFPYGRLQLHESSDGVCELVVESSSRQDAGWYRCVAENAYGSARTNCEVTVIQERKPAPDFDATLKEGKAPGFTVPLTIRRAKPGDKVIFECVPYGNPFPQIKWLKDGIELTATDKISFESLPDGTQRLHLTDVDFFSEGFFRCVATNEYGTASTKAELRIDGDRSMTRAPRDEPTEPEESKPRIRRGLYNQSIHQVRTDDVISYARNAKRRKSEQPKWLSSTNAIIWLVERKTFATSGNVVDMIVCATGWPTPTVKWFKDGEEIVSDGPTGRRVIFTDDLGIHHLVILNLSPEDEGDYSLVATNKLGEAKTEGALSVIRPRQVEMYGPDDRDGMPFPPGFVRQLKNKHVFTRMPTIFDCLVVGHPAPEVEWFHNGKRISPSGRIKIQSCAGGSHALIILGTTVEDAGEYVAVAKNCHGTASSSAILDVTVPHLDTIKFDGAIDVTPYLTEEYGFKKLNYSSERFGIGKTVSSEKLFALNVLMFAGLPTPPDRGPFIKEVTGHYLTLSWIPTKRAPPRYPQVSYVIEIRELPEKEWTLLDYNIPEPVCKVRNLELGKSYQFRVRAENIYGISDPSPASPPSRLMAPPQPVLDKKTKKVIPLLDPYAEKALDLAYAEQYACAPWFAPGVIDKRYCAENDVLSITLNVAGYPDPEIKWKFRGWDIDTTSPMSQCKVFTIGGTETTLLINSFTKDNVGQYQCFATNAYGEAQQNIMVDLAIRPNFIQPLYNRTFSDAQPMRLDVRVEGQPFPELKWLKEWRPIVESTRVKFVQDGPYLCSLIVTDPMWRDSGIYTCIAVNDAGQATTSCSVTVEGTNDNVRLENFDVITTLSAIRCRLVRKISRQLRNKKKMREHERLRANLNETPMTKTFHASEYYSVRRSDSHVDLIIDFSADGDFNDVELPKKRAMVEARKIREIYEIAEEDETLAASGAPFRVRERRTAVEFLAQLKPLSDALQRNVDMYNSVDHENIVRFHEVIKDDDLALIVYE